jgi:hypothetical protein
MIVGEKNRQMIFANSKGFTWLTLIVRPTKEKEKLSDKDCFTC